jgi:hypothetical protein
MAHPMIITNVFFVCSLCIVGSLHPVNLNSLSDKVKAGQSASTVLNSELPIFKATPGIDIIIIIERVSNLKVIYINSW